jgi:hypothetical protein
MPRVHSLRFKRENSQILFLVIPQLIIIVRSSGAI